MFQAKKTRYFKTAPIQRKLLFIASYLQNAIWKPASCLMFFHQSSQGGVMSVLRAVSTPPQHLWTCEAVPFSEAYNSTLCAAVCKNSIVWPLCSTQWTGHWCCMSKTARRREHSTHKEFCMLTCSMIHIFLWFIHRWACRKRHASVANV